MDKGKVIKELRLRNDMTQEELAKYLGTTKQTIYKYENNIVTNIPSDNIMKLAKLFNVSPLVIMGIDEKQSNWSFVHYRLPVLTTVAAGKPIFAEEGIIEWIDYDKDPGGHIRACRIDGTSMIPRIQDGDIVIFDRDLGWEDGDVVIATVNGDHATCKRIKRYADGIALISDNTAIAPMYFSKSEVESLPVHVVGRVIEVRGRL